jgi:hypothetical protein
VTREYRGGSFSAAVAVVIPFTGGPMTVSFGSEANVCTGGGQGAVAVNSSGTVVVVMLTTTSLVYSVGSVDLSTSTVSFPSQPNTAYAWGDEMPVVYFDVAIQDTGDQVVLVWQTGGGDNDLSYRTGTLNGGWITWNTIVPFDQGMFPSVSVAGTTVVEFHVSQNDSQKTYYHIGTLDGSSIDGFNQGGTEFAKYEDAIASTSCVITTNSWFVATTTGGPYEGLMVWSYSAAISAGLTLLSDTSVASGENSNVTLVNWGTLLELHDLNPDDIDFGTIYLSQGTLDENNDSGYAKFSWQGNISTNVAGMYPDIAASGGGGAASYIVMTYMSSDGTGSTKARCVTLS